MRINFIGNYQSGYVGEVADETHLVRSLEELGHTVKKVPRDIWKAYADGHWNNDWEEKLPEKADFNIICKWHHFNNTDYVRILRRMSSAPVFYWVWDYMYDEASANFIDWHKAIAEASDVLLTNEGGLIPAYEASLINAYYFPFDVADQDLPTYKNSEKYKDIDVSFFGSYFGKGDRVSWLTQINKEIPVTVFSWNHEEWIKNGFKAYQAVYGDKFNRTIARSKICLQFSVNDHTWGYWSNRTGKTLLAGGFLLARYAPGMELFLKDGVDYFHSPKEAIEKIRYYLSNQRERNEIQKKGYEIGRSHFTSIQRCKELIIFAQNYLSKKYTHTDLPLS